MMLTLSHEESRLNRFGSGNFESLRQEGIRQQLLAFHQKYYSANIMDLVVSSQHSLDQVEEWVREKFSVIENKNLELPNLAEPKLPFTAENLGMIVRFKPVQDKDSLEIFWILPYCENEFKTKPLRYFSHLFGHGGENSLLSYLKLRGFAMALTTKHEYYLQTFSTFRIEISLTQKGLTQYEDVLRAVFQYAKSVRDAGAQQYVYDECHQMG